MERTPPASDLHFGSHSPPEPYGIDLNDSLPDNNHTRRRIEHGYPTPSCERDAALDKAQPWLRERNIWSRGRFGEHPN